MIYPIHHLPDKIQVGIQTEQAVEVVGFDLKPWLDAFPDMSFAVWATRPGETEAYPVNDHMMVGTVLYWHPDGYDTAIAGEGKVEIAGVGENRRKLSGFAATAIQATSLGATKEPGESVSPWYEAVLQAAQDVKADVNVGTGGLYLVNTKDGRADRTQEEIRAAVAAGKTCLLVVRGKVYEYQHESKHPLGEVAPMFVSALEYAGNKGVYRHNCAYVLADGYVATLFSLLAVPNPQSLTIGGVVYDGSKAVAVMPAPTDETAAAYLRWNGTGYAPATIDQLKSDLGLTGGETTTEDVFYTADGQVFTTVDGAVLHAQKGAE